jgi:transketolase
MANALRALAMDAVEKAISGHPGMPMGMADIATVLFTKSLRYDPLAPDWPDRDRFVVSKRARLDAALRPAASDRLSRHVEAAAGFGWDCWTGPHGAFIGMHGFGASAPGEALYPHFGITPERVAQAARSLL